MMCNATGEEAVLVVISTCLIPEFLCVLLPPSQVVTYAKQLFPEEQRKDDPEGDMDVALGEGINGMFVDIHSSGGYIYFPWGHEKNKFSPDDESFQALGRKLRYYNGYKFWAPGSSDFLYPTSGDSTGEK